MIRINLFIVLVLVSAGLACGGPDVVVVPPTPPPSEALHPSHHKPTHAGPPLPRSPTCSSDVNPPIKR